MFAVSDVKYASTRKGVKAQGKVTRNGVIVGTFKQEPFAACIPSFRSVAIREEFNGQAAIQGKDPTDYCEALLSAWEDRQDH